MHLEQLEKNGSTAPFKIVWYKKLREGTDELDKNSELGSNTFRVVNVGMNMQNYFAIQRGEELPYPNKIGNRDNEALTKIMETLNGIDSRLTAIETPLESEEEEEEQTPTQKILGALSGVISHPSVQDLLATKLVGLLNLIPTGTNNTTPTIQKTLPMPLEEKDLPELNQHLQILIGAGMGLEDFKKLASIANTNPSQFNMLLTMLRNS